MKEDRVTISGAVAEDVVSGLSAEDDVRGRLREQFGLARDPFAEDSGFFFTGARRQHSIETLRHLACFGDMVLLVSGARGAGKTRTLAELCRREKTQLDFRLLPASQLASIRDLAACLLAQANSELPLGQSPELVISGFFRWSETAARKDRRMVLLVDDAERVPPEVLKVLVSAFRRASRSQAAIPLLAGEESLVRTLTGEEDAEGSPWLHQIALNPLSLDDIAEYVDQALSFGGGQRAEAPGKAKLKQILQQSEGSLGRLRRVTPAVLSGLSQGTPPSPPKSTRAPGGFGPARWVALVVLLMLVSYLAVSWFYKPDTSGSSLVQTTVIPERPMVHMAESASPPQMPAAQSAESAPDAGVDLPGDEGRALPSHPSGVPAPASSSPGRVVASPESSSPAASSGEPASEKTGASSTAAMTAPQTAQAAPRPVTPTSEAPKPAVSAVAGVLPKPVQPVASSAPVSQDRQRAVPAAKTPSPERRAPSRKAFAPSMPSKFVAVDALKSRGAYTIQMAAGHNESTAIDFIHQHASVSLVYTRSSYKGKPWYVVVHGTYRDSQEAHKALDQLSKAIRKQGPWVRRTAGL